MPKNEEYETEHMETGACSHTAASINLVQFLSCWQLAVLQRVDLANIFPNIHHATDTADRGDQQCNALWYLDNMVSSPIGLSEFWESEPMWTCQNINSIHDQGRRCHYLEGRPSK